MRLLVEVARTFAGPDTALGFMFIKVVASWLAEAFMQVVL